MTQSNLSNSTSGAEHSAFQSAQSALARKPLPGPRWVWPGVAALAVVGVAYLVAGTSGEHAGSHAAPAPSAEGAPPEAPNPVTTTVAALEPTPPPPAAAPSNAPASPTPAANDLAAAPPKAEAEPAKASDDAEPAAASGKKKARGAAHRAKRKRAAKAE